MCDPIRRVTILPAALAIGIIGRAGCSSQTNTTTSSPAAGWCRIVPTAVEVLATGNLAIGQLLQGFVDGDEESTRIINASIGPDSPIGLKADKIAAYCISVLGMVAGIGKEV